MARLAKKIEAPATAAKAKPKPAKAEAPVAEEIKLSGQLGVVKGQLSRGQRAQLRKLKNIFQADHRHRDRWNAAPIPVELLKKVGASFELKK